MNIYKCYEMHLPLKVIKLIAKVSYLHIKQKHTSFANQVRKQIFECQIKSNLNDKNSYFDEDSKTYYSHLVLSIA